MAVPRTEGPDKRMLDQLRRDIQSRLDQLVSEADKLRRVLAILGPRDGSKAPLPSDDDQAASTGRRTGTPSTTRTATRRQPPTARAGERATLAAGSRTARSASGDGAAAGARTAPGATKTAVLAALAAGDAMTAGEVATATGLGRASVSTTLSKLAKTGEITKAARGYQIAGAAAVAADQSAHEQDEAAT